MSRLYAWLLAGATLVPLNAWAETPTAVEAVTVAARLPAPWPRPPAPMF